MNKHIANFVQNEYGLDVQNASTSDFLKVEKINVSDVTMNHEYGEWDFSAFPNLKEIDCSYNPIELLNISSNHKLEYIRFEGARGDIPHKIDFSGNPLLKKVRCGQDGVKELDFSSNKELEDLSICISSSLRWIDLSQCTKLKKIALQGVNIPFVNLTNCPNLESVNINYWNLYRNKSGEYGPGFPRPFVFVKEDFDENIIDSHTRQYDYYTYFLIRVKPNSPEETFLNMVKDMKAKFLAIPADNRGVQIAITHYILHDIYDSLKTK